MSVTVNNNSLTACSLSFVLNKVEYDLLNSSTDDLRLISSERIEQSAVPQCFAWYPPIVKENFLLVANDQVISLVVESKLIERGSLKRFFHFLFHH